MGGVNFWSFYDGCFASISHRVVDGCGYWPYSKTAQQLRALELLGKVTEVAAFTERREIIKVNTSGTAKSRLLASLRLAIEDSVTDVTLKPATELLEELAQAEKAGDGDPTQPPTPHTHNF